MCIRDRYFVDEFLDDSAVFETILRAGGDATVEQVLAEMDTDGEDLNRDLLDEQLAALQAELVLAVKEMLPEVPPRMVPDDWLDFKRGRELPIGHRGVWEWVYGRICDEKMQEARRVDEEARRKSGFGGLFGPALAREYTFAKLSAQVHPLRGLGVSQQITHVNLLRGRVETTRAEVRALQQEHRLVEELFDATQQPEGFGLALQVFGVIAVLGMGVPVVIMGFIPFALPDWARALVVAVFFFAVGLLLRFLFVYANYLRGGRQGLPSWIGGLLRSDRI